MNADDIQRLLTRYIDKRWVRRLLVLRWLDEAGGKIEWNRLRQMCSERWYPLSFYVLYTQLFRDGLVFTRWIYSGHQADETDAWTYSVIPDDIHPMLSAHLGAFRGEIDRLLENSGK